MDAVILWAKDNWFSLLQGVGIVSGLFFTALSARREAHTRRITNLLSLTQQHRELWTHLLVSPDLKRVAKTEADLVSEPVSLVEEEFLNLVIVHFHTGWKLARLGPEVSLLELRKDARNFFSRPVVRAVWEQTKANRDCRFVQFVDECLENSEGNGWIRG